MSGVLKSLLNGLVAIVLYEIVLLVLDELRRRELRRDFQ